MPFRRDKLENVEIDLNFVETAEKIGTADRR